LRKFYFRCVRFKPVPVSSKKYHQGRHRHMLFRTLLFAIAAMAMTFIIPVKSAKAFCVNKQVVVHAQSAALVKKARIRRAKRRAQRRWKRMAKRKFGDQFKSFGYARNSSLTCNFVRSGPKKNLYYCIMRGTPCDANR